METLKLSEHSAKEILSRAEGILASGGLIIVPTDTVYGIMGRADSENAIKKIFVLKKRPEEKALPIFVKDISMARKYAYISDAKAKFLEKIWPGPVTAVFHHKEKLPVLLTGGAETIGIRIPNSAFILELLKRSDVPLVQTSANISTRLPAKNVGEVDAHFGQAEEKPDLVIDGGEVSGKHSTAIDFTGSEPRLLRTGAVTKEELDRVLKTVQYIEQYTSMAESCLQKAKT